MARICFKGVIMLAVVIMARMRNKAGWYEIDKKVDDQQGYAGRSDVARCICFV